MEKVRQPHCKRMFVTAGHFNIILKSYLDAVLGTFGPSIYKSAGHFNIILKSYLDVVLGTFGPSLYKSAEHFNIILKSYLDVVPSFNRTVVSFYLKGVGNTGRDLERFREGSEPERSAERRNDGI